MVCFTLGTVHCSVQCAQCSCFYRLRRLQSVCQQLDFVISPYVFIYCNAVFVCLSTLTLAPLSCTGSAQPEPHDHVTPVQDLLWLPILDISERQ